MTDDHEHLRHLAELAEAGLAAASLVHELRQPLFAIKSLGQLAGPDGMTREDVGQLLEAVRHLEDLLDGWRHVGRHEPARLYDLGSVARDVAMMLAPRQERIDAEVRIHAEGPVWVEGAPGIGRQVLLNLMQNGLDAVEGQGTRHVEVHFLHDDELVTLEVHDTGDGLEPGIVDRIFEPFVTTKGRRGTGLGLFVSQGLCEAEGGSLEVFNTASGATARARFARIARGQRDL